MNQTHAVAVQIISMSTTFPFVDAVKLNGEVVGYISENRDWNKEIKPVSLVSVEGAQLGDFCCIAHAATYITEKKTGISFDEIEIVRNAEIRNVDFPSDLLDAFALFAAGLAKGKRPH